MITKIYSVIRQASIALLVLGIVFTAVEPAISLGATTSQFTVTQAVTTEVSFATLASNVSLSPALGGITGGTANGSTQVVVNTNDILGYNMTIQASSSVGMIGNASSSNSIPAYVPAVAAVPDYTFTVPVNKAYYGFSVKASSTSDVAQLFRDNGSACNTGSNNTAGACWLNASTTQLTIINRNLPTPAPGATSTLYFRVQIQANPSPTIPNDNYVATSTLTVNAN
jgi:hypothetical protein